MGWLQLLDGDEANVDGYVHIADEVLRSLIVCMDEGEQDHYMLIHAIEIDRRCIRQRTPRWRDHHLFLHTAQSLCNVCARAWLDQGADTSHGTPCEPLKSAFRWAEDGDDELLSTLRAPAAARSRLRSAECKRATTGASRCCRPLGQDGRQGLPEKRPPSLVIWGRRSRSQCCGGPEQRLGEAQGHLRVRQLLHFYSASRCGRG